MIMNNIYVSPFFVSACIVGSIILVGVLVSAVMMATSNDDELEYYKYKEERDIRDWTK